MKLSKSVIFLLSALALAFIGLVLFKDKLIVNKVGKVSVTQVFQGLTVPLVDAIVDGDYEAADALLRQGADINQIGMQEEITPLIWVGIVTQRDLKKMEYMLKNGASVNIRSKRGESAMSLAAGGDSKALLELFLKYGGDATLEGPPLTMGDSFRRNLLMMAIGAFRDDYFELLLSHGADVNWNIDGTKGLSTVPNKCITVGRYDWLLYFLEKGYKGDLHQLGIEVKNRHVSAKMEPYKQKAIQYLKDKGVDMDAIPVYSELNQTRN